MKRILLVVWLGFLATALLLPVTALAEGTALDGQSFFSWEALGTFGGVVALTVFLVQMLKLPLDKVWRIPTRYVVYVVSLSLLLLAQLFIPSKGGLTWDTGLLCVFNAALVSLSAMSVYTELIQKIEEDKLTQMIADGTLAITREGIILDEPGAGDLGENEHPPDDKGSDDKPDHIIIPDIFGAADIDRG